MSSPSLFNGPSIRDVTLTSRYDKPHRRPVLPVLASTGDDGCAPQPDLTLRIADFISHGHSVPSLVYACIVEPISHVVVVKLLVGQEDKSPHNIRIPQELYETVSREDPDDESAMMALSWEADRFEQLAPLQGTTVPSSYGFYSFELPNGPSVVGHVMEFVPSVNIEDYFEHIKHDKWAFGLFMTRLCNAFIDMHRLDVCHRDAGVRNLRLLPKHDIEIVLVDFGQASSIRYSISKGLFWWSGEKHGLTDLFEELDEEVISDWREKDGGEELFKRVLLGPDELAALEAEAETAAAGTLY